MNTFVTRITSEPEQIYTGDPRTWPNGNYKNTKNPQEWWIHVSNGKGEGKEAFIMKSGCNLAAIEDSDYGGGKYKRVNESLTITLGGKE
jgi:hypothetical protein